MEVGMIVKTRWTLNDRGVCWRSWTFLTSTCAFGDGTM